MSVGHAVISVRDLGKVYRIGLKEKKHDNLVSSLVSFLKSPLKNYRYYKSLYNFSDIKDKNNTSGVEGNGDDYFWALRNVSFEIQQGDVLGVIGSNGAGKSTLLKILSRITDPTSGEAKIRGRVSSLLEVGTGFHPELTGRENIYLNGCILGMRKVEIDRKFDEIVEFSGIGKFIDTPVKRYSSGMSVRLAFSVAAHLEPEILLIDEVLSVGDAAFQRKCIGRMNTVASQGRTILFVSHNMGAVTNLCKNALWLEHGQVKRVGPSSEVVSAYLSEQSEGQAIWENPQDIPFGSELSIRSASIRSTEGEPKSIVDFREPFQIDINYELLKPIKDLSVCVQIANSQGVMAYETMDTDLLEYRNAVREPGKYFARCFFDDSLLKPENYFVTVVAFIDRIKLIDRRENILSFTVSESGYDLNLRRLGAVVPRFKWDVERVPTPHQALC
jgi:homopolymeric O-antigen transport system ATP-binding protein